MHIVLVEPEIPGNTGNIARLCAGTGMELHLVRPLGFSTDDKHLKRAGLDYWHLVRVHYHDSFAALHQQYQEHTFYFCSTKARHSYCDISYKMDDFLVLLTAHAANTIRIPMREEARSLNLSNAVAVVAFEALRQHQFADLRIYGNGCCGRSIQI